MTRPPLTDRTALRRNRARATARGAPVDFLHRAVAADLQERLAVVNRAFTAPALVCGHPAFWPDLIGALGPETRVVPDEDTLDLREDAHDLVVHALALHWADDPVGQLVQARRALRPDGLLLVASFGGETLAGLRHALARAEAEIAGGLSPRVLPMGEIRDLGALLQRAGLALPVADSAAWPVSYASLSDMMHDLRGMGEANALAERLRRPTRRAVFSRAEALLRESDTGPDGRLQAVFEVVTLTGWAPGPGQPEPLRPGSAAQRLADALGTEERPLPGSPPDRRD